MMVVVVSLVCGACARGELTAKVTGAAAAMSGYCNDAFTCGLLGVCRLGFGCTWIAACDDHDGTD
jgi:hypothetical protein